ncbi:MAG: peptidylprolyl isomerase [Planctomycetota bacterium]
MKARPPAFRHVPGAAPDAGKRDNAPRRTAIIDRPPSSPKPSMLLPLLACLACQPPSLPEPSPPARIELAHGLVVTGEDYLRHLYATIGSARLRELLLDRALAREAEALEAGHLPEAVAAALRDPDAAARQAVAARLRTDYGGDAAAYRATLAAVGMTEGEDLWATRLATLREARIAALVQTAREPTPARLHRVFDEHYGVDGLRVVVRQVFQSFGAERNKARQARSNLSDAEIEENVRKRVAALMALHASGTPFHLLVARGSEDPKGRALALSADGQARAGEIEGYNFQHFGPEFADAVRSMREGEVRGPLRTSHGYHIVKLEKLERTAFADVEPRLRELLRQEPPSLAERRELLEQLGARYGIEAALRR